MARKREKLPLIGGLEIVDIAAEGKAVGRWNEQVVFVPMAVPGDVVDVQITNKRRRFMEGFVTNYVKRSPLRTEPFCEHFSVCGGCKWQHLPYLRQLAFKQQQVEDQLTRIGKIELPEISPISGSAKTVCYRNKLEYTFSNKRWMTRAEIGAGEKIENPNALGFHVPGMFDKILDIRKCWLQPDPSNAVRLAVDAFCQTRGYEYYDARTHTGLMRNIIIRTASTGEVMVVVIFAREDEEKRVALLDHLVEKFPEITSLIYVINGKFNDTIGDQETICYAGRDHIFEEMEGLRFKIGPKSFYQTNSEQAYELYKTARDFAGLTGSEVVYDLYTGTGTIAHFVARDCQKVVGIEYVPEAIEDARVNSELNGIANAVFYAGDMKDVLNERFIGDNGRPDVVILDPPRAGIHNDVAQAVLAAAPERIVYVSCNPATQARDIALFDTTYRVTRVQPVDMFPHTHHVENVVLLVKRQPSKASEQ
ncbi:MAG: 23S rRNA (uracil(1939)-C(5))-methyltransferase RlmD [Rikenellaceae bacterium]|nr:23S rRNA (uracil(1939)-C(5))-methyltransferase RlmD [Rikenellaceae bacterium]